MNRIEIFNTIQCIFRDVFNDDKLFITDSTNSSQIEDWDSLNHINLVTSIEKEFGIKFRLAELESLENVGGMVNLILSKLTCKI